MNSNTDSSDDTRHPLAHIPHNGQTYNIPPHQTASRSFFPTKGPLRHASSTHLPCEPTLGLSQIQANMWAPNTIGPVIPFGFMPTFDTTRSESIQDGFSYANSNQLLQATCQTPWGIFAPATYAQYSTYPLGQPYIPLVFEPSPFFSHPRPDIFNLATYPAKPDHSSSFNPPASYSLSQPPLSDMSDKKIARPSPIPLPAYVLRAQSQPILLGGPTTGRPLLVIIDLNGTILFRPNKSKPTKFTLRDDAEKFLHHVLKRHFVLVWSSAQAHNVEAMAGALFASMAEQKQHLLGIWARDKLRLSKKDEYRNVQVYKQLNWVWEDQEIRGKSLAYGQSWDETNTLLLDDSATKAASHPFNWVEVPEWKGKEESWQHGSALGQIVAYIEEASRYANVGAWVREKPFVVDGGWQGYFGMGEAEMEFSDDEETEPGQ